jgi:hypothetical protein
VPDSVYACTAAGQYDCDAANNYANSMVALNLDDGMLRIARQFSESRWGYDAYTTACAIDGQPRGPLPGCPAYSGLDADFGMAPILVTAKPARGRPIDLAVAGNKAGMVYALNRDTGALVWATKVGPDGMAAGGIAFGAAYDGKRLLFSNVNSGGVNNPSVDGKGVEWTLIRPVAGTPTKTRGGFWSALDPHTGAILWQRAEPNEARLYGWISAFKHVFVSGSFSLVNSNLFVIRSRTGEIVRTDFTLGSRFPALSAYKNIYCGGNGYLGQSFYRMDNRLYCYKLENPDYKCPDEVDD